jgi:LuxR family transcriptional activator of bioluminescence operon/LuxR family quorum-sensing transcriptional regulator LasR
MHLQHIEEFIERITLCESLVDLQNLCGAIAAQNGFELYCLGHRDFTSLAKPEDILLSNFPEEWKQYYFEQQYDRIDPVIFTSIAEPTPVIWQDAFLQYPEHIHILNERGEVGARIGVSAAVPMPGMFTLLSFASPRMVTKNLRKGAIAVNAYVGYFHERLLDLCNKNIAPPTALTTRQLEVVFWLAEGKDISSIAAILKCSERTVSAHVQTIKEQTNSLNITHAVAKTLLNRREFRRIIGVAD